MREGWRVALSRVVGRRPAIAVEVAAVVAFAVVATGISRRAVQLPAWNEWFPWWVKWPLWLWGAGVLAAGAVICGRGAGSARLGQLMTALASAYYVQFLAGSRQPTVFAAGFCLGYLWTAVAVHLVLAWPTGRIASRGLGAVVTVSYLTAIGTQAARYLIDRPPPPQGFGIPEANTATAQVSSILAAVVALLVVGVVARRWATATRLHRRPGEPAWGAIAVTCVLAAGVGAASAASSSVRLQMPLLVAALWTALLLVPTVHWIQRQRARSVHWSLASVALDAGPPDPARLQQALGDAVGDPTLRLVYPIDADGHVDIDGHAVSRPRPGPGRAVTPVRRHGRLYALIEHDEALSGERRLAEATSAAAGLAIENAHLYATMQARIEQVRGSQLRLAAAGLEERRRIQRDLHDGAQQQLFAVLVLLDMARHELGPAAGGPARQARTTIGRAHGQLSQAIAALRELTENIYPMTLAEHGLAHAIDSMADLAPVPVSVRVPGGRWPSQAETTAYFVICEALANVYKHAQAAKATVTVTPSAGDLLIEVSDNGRGGARVVPGHGLAGLRDRVAAVGGTMSVGAGPEQGTRLTARLPLDAT